jgi:hypothetical protein
MKNLRADLMDAIGKQRKMNEENSLFQSKATTAGTIQALKYQFTAEAADLYASAIDMVLRKYGL